MSDDEEYRLKKAFPIDLVAGGVKLRPGEAPADAIEYLKLVAFEASHCKDVVVASIDEKKLKKQTVVYPSNHGTPHSQASPAVQPSREWKIYQVSDFSNLRSHLAKMKMSSSACSKKTKTKELPRKTDESAWCVFCCGSKAAQAFGEAETNGEEIDANPPLARIICSMDQPMIEKLLEYHINWMTSGGFSAQQGLWIYSLMAGLELPLTPDVCSLLRDLARNSASTRDQMLEKGEENLVVSLNLIICLVSKYFRQLDLEDL